MFVYYACEGFAFAVEWHQQSACYSCDHCTAAENIFS
jgi:hypothetical protein